MGLIGEVSPRALVDIYVLLPAESRTTFLELLAARLTADELAAIAHAMPILERNQFFTAFSQSVRGILQPVMSREAARLFRALPGLSEGELAGEIDKAVTATITDYVAGVREVQQAEFKQKRDRKPGAETVRRNVEICDLRKQNRKVWSLTKLAKKYTVSNRAITKVLHEEAKWRQLAREIGTD